MWVALDPPSADQAPQEGILNIRDFAVRGEAALERVAAGAPSSQAAQSPGVEFSRHAGRFHPHARPLHHPRRRGAAAR